jgi:hypothetical protein
LGTQDQRPARRRKPGAMSVRVHGDSGSRSRGSILFGRTEAVRVVEFCDRQESQRLPVCDCSICLIRNRCSFF